MRMALARFLDDRRAEVDANADGWLEARKQIPYSATELHDFRALGNEEPHITEILIVEIGVLLDPPLTFSCRPVEEVTHGDFSRRHPCGVVRIQEYIHHCNRARGLSQGGVAIRLP